MIHNFWSFRYIINCLTTTTENFGIKVKLIKENHTSSTHRDVVEVLNIVCLLNAGRFNRALASPEPPRIYPLVAQTSPLGILAF